MKWEYTINIVDLIGSDKLNTKTLLFIQDLIDSNVCLNKLDELLEENGINNLKKMEKFFEEQKIKEFIITYCA